VDLNASIGRLKNEENSLGNTLLIPILNKFLENLESNPYKDWPIWWTRIFSDCKLLEKYVNAGGNEFEHIFGLENSAKRQETVKIEKLE
jgi:hypothetical protein